MSQLRCSVTCDLCRLNTVRVDMVRIEVGCDLSDGWMRICRSLGNPRALDGARNGLTRNMNSQ